MDPVFKPPDPTVDLKQKDGDSQAVVCEEKALFLSPIEQQQPPPPPSQTEFLPPLLALPAPLPGSQKFALAPGEGRERAVHQRGKEREKKGREKAVAVRKAGGSAPGRLNWSYRETVVLLDAVRKYSDERAHICGVGACPAGGPCVGIGRASQSPNSERWERVAASCAAHGVFKATHQCCNRWDKLWPRFKKILDYEAASPSHADPDSDSSYWRMTPQVKHSKGLPESFNRDVFEAMAERFGQNRVARTAGKVSIDYESKDLNTKSLLRAPDVIENGAPEPLLGRKRRRESNHPKAILKDPQAIPKDTSEDISNPFFQMYERLENARQSSFEQLLEETATMMKDQMASDVRTTSMISSSLNRIVEALNNVAAMAAKKMSK